MVRVLARQDGKQSALLVLVAEVPVEPPPLSDEHLLPVPTEPRRALESALEDIANAFAVFFMARRSISSVMPWPSVSRKRHCSRSGVACS